MSLIGIDIGTTGTKAIAFNEDGSILAGAYREYDLLFPEAGWVECNNKVMWKKIFDVIGEVNSQPEVKRDPVTALSVSTFGEGFTPVDGRGNMLYNTIYSTDARSVKELEHVLTGYSEKELFERTGFPAKYICPLNKIMWMKNNLPEVYKNTKKFLFTEDLFMSEMRIENPRINYSLCSRTLFFDLKEKKWADDILDTFDIDPDLFSKPSPSALIIGSIHPEIAEKLGFNYKGRVSMVSGVHDQPGAALGVGAVAGGIAADGMGTVECVTTCMDEINVSDNMRRNNFSCQAHAIEGKYVTLAYNMGCGSVVKWFRDNFLDGDGREIGKLSSEFDFQPSRIYFLPYFSASGTPYMDPRAKGSIIGLSLDSDKRHILKALLEGLVMEICFNLELARKSGVKINELRAVGGGSKSDFELQLKASILGKPIKRMDLAEAGCLSSMILAGIGTGKFTLEEAAGKFVKVNREFFPDEKTGQRYKEKFENYKKIYGLVSQLA